MREIKFRFFDKKNHVYVKPDLIRFTDKGEYIIETVSPFDEDKRFLWAADLWETKLEDVLSVEQYTGINDRMGKNIYEGDIVEVSEYQRGGHTILDEQTFGMIEQWDDIDTAIRGVVAIWASKGAVLTNITVEEPEQFEGTDYSIPKWLPLRKNELVVGNINAMPEALTDYD